MTVKGSVHPFLLRVLGWELNLLPAILDPVRRQVNVKGLSNASVVAFLLTRGQSAERRGRIR